MPERSAAGAIWPHLPSGERSVAPEKPSSLANAMYGHLAKQQDEAKAQEKAKAEDRKLAADLRETRMEMEKKNWGR